MTCPRYPAPKPFYLTDSSVSDRNGIRDCHAESLLLRDAGALLIFCLHLQVRAACGRLIGASATFCTRIGAIENCMLALENVLDAESAVTIRKKRSLLEESKRAFEQEIENDISERVSTDT